LFSLLYGRDSPKPPEAVISDIVYHSLYVFIIAYNYAGLWSDARDYLSYVQDQYAKLHDISESSHPLTWYYRMSRITQLLLCSTPRNKKHSKPAPPCTLGSGYFDETVYVSREVER
jgi:hypothetical protein